MRAGDPKKVPSRVPQGIEEVLEKKLEELVLVLRSGDDRKSRLYEDILDIVEKGLIKIALRRSNQVKTSAAVFLGINRNTFQKKMTQLGITNDKKKKKQPRG
ncbi:MAG TPA: helix-turn-helix domain-containing protein [Syntrophales bacterium]|nr:helix-turn-helix domain-containing protein [Syntrophales bacterium]HOX93459.1 helix-turn-helix domain-containing protein [Syntrophales bacterium]HPI57572.1 helix-turn-helix domain-containing protein [Syntrophales bacterium]HPN24729.1 helix-turn-helix domain-containing protein [Syntrophales bacterium]HQM29859.1 helix-turn-helix domain-containing protein [Syntrophales bacterium]